MTTGTVKWFSADKGFGFIAVAGGLDVFVHHSQVEGSLALHEGQRVEFETAQGPKGPQARRVRPAPAAEPAPVTYPSTYEQEMRTAHREMNEYRRRTGRR